MKKISAFFKMIGDEVAILWSLLREPEIVAPAHLPNCIRCWFEPAIPDTAYCTDCAEHVKRWNP